MNPVGSPDVVHLVITWSHDLEQALLDVEGEPDDDDGSYHRDVPAELWRALLDAEAARESAYRRILEAAGFDGAMGRMTAPCGAWVGDLDPGRTWWAVELAPSGDDPESWPARAAEVAVRDTQRAAVSLLESLPAEFLLLPAGGQLQHVRRDRLQVSSRGWGPSASSCRRCGWARADHGDVPAGPGDAAVG